MNLLAVRTGTLLNISELSHTSGLPMTTLKRYLTLLENRYLCIDLPPWFNNRSKQVTKTSKVYLSDVKLLGYLLDLGHTGLISNLPPLGHIIENFVVIELKKQQTWSSIPTRMCHYRTHTGAEVDIILETYSGDILTIEVKSSQKLMSKYFASIQHLQQQNKNKRVWDFVVYLGRDVIPLSKNLTALPIENLWCA